MSARTERARARFIKASRETAAHLHSFTVRAHDAKHMKALYLTDKSRANRMAYRLAKKIRARRLRTYRRSRVRRNALKVIYLASKKSDRQPLRLKARAEARKLLGIVEQSGNNTGPEVDRIIRANGGDIGEPWCGDFVAYCYRRAGSKVVDRSWAAAHAGIWGWMTGVRRIKPQNIKAGDIVEYVWQHTGIADEAPDANGNLSVDEGNTGKTGNTSDTTRDGAHKRTDRNISQIAGAFRVLR